MTGLYSLEFARQETCSSARLATESKLKRVQSSHAVPIIIADERWEVSRWSCVIRGRGRPYLYTGSYNVCLSDRAYIRWIPHQKNTHQYRSIPKETCKINTSRNFLNFPIYLPDTSSTIFDPFFNLTRRLTLHINQSLVQHGNRWVKHSLQGKQSAVSSLENSRLLISILNWKIPQIERLPSEISAASGGRRKSNLGFLSKNIIVFQWFP